MKMDTKLISRIARKVVADEPKAYHFEKNTRHMQYLVECADECFEKNGNDSEVPKEIRDLSATIKDKAHEFEKMFGNDDLKPCIPALREIEDLFSRQCDLILNWLKGAVDDYRRYMMDKHYIYYMNGTQFEIDMKEEIAWREKDLWKKTYDFDGAVQKVFGTIKSMMNPYTHKETNLIDLAPFGIPKGWNFLGVTTLDADGKTLLLETRTKNDRRRMPGGSVVFRNDTAYSDQQIRDEAEWMVHMIEDKD